MEKIKDMIRKRKWELIPKRSEIFDGNFIFGRSKKLQEIEEHIDFLDNLLIEIDRPEWEKRQVDIEIALEKSRQTLMLAANLLGSDDGN